MSCLKGKNPKKQQGAVIKLKSHKLLSYTLNMSHRFQGSIKEIQIDVLSNRPEGRTMVCSQNQKAIMKFGIHSVKAFLLLQITCTLLNKSCKKAVTTLTIQVVAPHFTLLTISSL